MLVLDETLTAQLKQRQSAGLANDIEFPLAKCLARLEVAGIAVASDELDRLHDQFDARVSAAAEAAYEAIGHEVNLASPKQLQGVLFEELGMPKTRRTKSGYTTDADALEWLFTQKQHPFLAHLLEHRDAIRLRQTVTGLSSAIADDGRIHTTFLQTKAATGRLSSVDPNLQNIPIRTEAGREIRKVFVAGDGYEGLLTADYSQIEMRLMAHMSGDAGLIDSFRQGSDFHSQMAAIVFGVDPANVSLEQRSKIKAMNYGLAYGLSAFGLSKQLRIGVPEAKHLMDEYFARFGTAQNYLQQVVADAVRCGYTETMWGRRRYLPDLTSSNRGLREIAERAALNAPIQGSAADIIKLAMLSVQRAMDHAGLASRMLLQVHDELIFEVAPGEREGLEKLVSDEMRNAANLAVDL
ncbi:MAG: DNA polymerase I, partial [Propionibacterium sp.]